MNFKWTPYSKADHVFVEAYDVIVIGSGMGGMACASALAQSSERVLVLEQHYVAGGLTHAFSRKGFHWDVGVHCVGEMRETDIPGKMFQWVTAGQVEMKLLGDNYENFFFPGDFHLPFPSSEKEFRRVLREKFPEDHQAIDDYFFLVKKVVASSKPFYASKMFSHPIAQLMLGAASLGARLKGEKPIQYYFEKTVEEVLSPIVPNPKLRTALTGQWGYYGNTPAEASFAVHALTAYHFFNGGYYPVGGAPKIAEAVYQVLKSNQSEMIVRASVDEILVESGRVAGVQMADGKKIFAKKVVSAIGVRNTLNLLKNASVPQDWKESIESLGYSPAYICLNIGFQGDIVKAGATPGNQWFFETWDSNSNRVWDLAQPDQEAPILFVSFPSLKDPTHDPGTEKSHTGEVVTFVPWECFEGWTDTRRGFRTKEYQQYKDQISERLLTQMKRINPKLMSLMTYSELSTPLSMAHFTRTPHGGIYGLDVTPERFKNPALRTKTPISGLHLTGADVTTGGVAGALSAGILTAGGMNSKVLSKIISMTGSKKKRNSSGPPKKEGPKEALLS